MKLQIMQLGGFMPPYTVYLPVMVNSGTARLRAGSYESSSSGSSSKSSSSSDKDDLTMKDIILMAEKMDGLPSDLAHITQLLTLLSLIASIPGMANSSTLATYYLTTLAEIKNAKYYKERYDKAFEDINKKQALNEVAISPDGNLLYITEEGEYKPVSIEDYKEDPLSYQLVSNSDILNIRALSTPMDHTYINALVSATSMPAINALLHDYITTLGREETTTSKYSAIKSEKLLKGLESLLTSVENGQINVNVDPNEITQQITHSNNKNEIDSALLYLWNLLPENAKTLLKYHSLRRNGNGTDEEARAVIASLLYSQYLSKEVKIDKEKYDDGTSGRSGSKKSSSASTEGSFNNDLFLNIVAGNGGSYGTFTIEDKDGYTYQVNGVLYPDLSISTSTPIPSECTLSELMTKYHLAGIKADSSKSITFGSHALDSSEDLKNIVYVNNSNATRVILPTTIDENGNIVPDLAFATEHKALIDKVNTELNESGELSQETLKELSLLNFRDPFTGIVDTSKLQPYLLVDGLSTDRDISKGNNFISETLDDRYIEAYTNGMYQKADADHEKTKKIDFDRYNKFNPFDMFGSYTKLYKGIIYIPITQNLLQALTAAGTTIKTGDAKDVERTYLRGTMHNAFNDTSSEKLGNI